MGMTPVNQKEDQYAHISPAFRKEQQLGPGIRKGNLPLRQRKHDIYFFLILGHLQHIHPC